MTTGTGQELASGLTRIASEGWGILAQARVIYVAQFCVSSCRILGCDRIV